jgi:hypothetical protein
VVRGTALAAKLTAAAVPAASTRDVVEQVALGNPLATQFVHDAGRDISCVFAGAANLLNPWLVVIGSVLTLMDKVLLVDVRKRIYRRAPPLATRRLRIDPNHSGENAAVGGAALLVPRQILAPAAIDARIGSGYRNVSLPPHNQRGRSAQSQSASQVRSQSYSRYPAKLSTTRQALMISPTPSKREFWRPPKPMIT